MAATQNSRIHDGLIRLVEHFLSHDDDDSINQTLEVCRRILEKCVTRHFPHEQLCVFQTNWLAREDGNVEPIGDVEYINELIKRKRNSLAPSSLD